MQIFLAELTSLLWCSLAWSPYPLKRKGLVTLAYKICSLLKQVTPIRLHYSKFCDVCSVDAMELPNQ